MTLNRRKEIAAQAQEHAERIQVVRTLQGAVAEKDELMSVSLPPLQSFQLAAHSCICYIAYE